MPDDARFCPNCGRSLERQTRVEIRQEVEQNLGRVIGVQTQAIQGDVYGGDIYEVRVYALSDAGRTASWRRFLKEGTPPYKFLAPYSAQDRLLFKARDTEIEQVVRQVGEQRLVVVYGLAGVGKTSLLAAGVIPTLIDSGALVVHIHDYLEPVKTIRAALAASSEQLPITLPDEPTFPDLVRAVVEATQGSLVLVFDQFERLLKPSVSDEQRAALIGGLAEAWEAVSPDFLRLVISVREDVLGQLGPWRSRLPDLLQSPIQLTPLSRAQAQVAIEGPLAELDYPVSFVGDLVTAQLAPDLDELTPSLPGIQPPQLQIVCHWLYQAARERRPPHIDDKLYNEPKGAAGIMARYLEDTLQSQPEPQRELAKQVLVTMASPGVGPWVPPEKLIVNGNGTRREKVLDVLEDLVEAELLVPRAVNSHREYAFASDGVAEEMRRLAGPELERRYQVEDELERVWSGWLAREALATRGQLHYLCEFGNHLAPRPVQALLLLRCAVARDTPAAVWLPWLRTDEARALIRQLEEPNAPDLPEHASRSNLSYAASLLGLSSDQPAQQNAPFGPIAWSASSHADPVTRQTAALALAAWDPYQAPTRLDWALRAAEKGWRRRSRRAELRGTLGDADPEIAKANQDLPLLDRFLTWWWRARRRIFRDRHRLAALTFGGAIGAGLGLGLLRAVIGGLARQLVGVQFAIYFYWAAILGAALSLGMALAEPLLLQPEQKGETSRFWRLPVSPNRLPALLAVGLGTLFFGFAHVLVAWLNGLSLTGRPLVAPMGFVAGLGLSLAVVNQPRAGRHLGVLRWVARLGTAAVIFALTQTAFILARNKGTGIAIARAGSSYRADFTRYTMPWWQALMERYPRWFDGLALLDAALVGIVLTIGITAGLIIAADWLRRWQALVARAGD